MSDNLPPGTTPQDIDDNFGDPGGVEVTGVVLTEVTVLIQGHPTEKEKREALMNAVQDGKGDKMEVPQMDERRIIP